MHTHTVFFGYFMNLQRNNKVKTDLYSCVKKQKKKNDNDIYVSTHNELQYFSRHSKNCAQNVVAACF